MKENPTVSVIMIFLDAEKYIEEAIESVLSQSFADWELLLVDDGSTDRSTAIARSYVAQHPARLRYLEHPDHRNAGMSASRNLGVQNARGRYIAFLDSDDVWMPERLRCHLNIFRNRPDVAMVYGPSLNWFSWTGKVEDRDRDSVSSLYMQPNAVVEPPTLVTLFLRTKGGAAPGICSLLIRRDALEEVGGSEESFRGMYEDQVLIAKICLKNKVFVTGDCLDRYRQHPESSCQAAVVTGHYHPKRPNPARRRYLDWLERYVQTEQIHDPALWRALQREMMPYRRPVLSRMMAAPGKTVARTARSLLPPTTYKWLQSFHRW